jgi:UTP:GlnB (protein PII) uridylyltransferase
VHLDEELVELAGSAERTRSTADVIGQDLRLPPGLNALVEVVAGQDTGKVFRFTRGNVNVGRRAGEVPLSDGEVSRRHSVIEVFGRDRPGFLYGVARALHRMGVGITFATVSTEGRRAADTFYVTEASGAKLSRERIDAAREALLAVVGGA